MTLITPQAAIEKLPKFEQAAKLNVYEMSLLKSVLKGEQFLTRKALNSSESMRDLALFLERMLARHKWLADDQVNGIIGDSTIKAANDLAQAYGLPVATDRVFDGPLLRAIIDGTKGRSSTEHVSFFDRARAFAQSKGYTWYDKPGFVNMVCVRGYRIVNTQSGPDGVKIPNIDDIYNDAMFWLWTDATGKQHARSFVVSADPGYYYYLLYPLNKKGCAHLAEGQHAWQRGKHGKAQYKALVQAEEFRVYRSFSGSYKLTDSTEKGWFGINHHAGTPGPRVNNASAGCNVKQGPGYKSVDWQNYIDALYAFNNHFYPHILTSNI